MNSTTTNVPQSPNPLTIAAYLPPTLVFELTILTYVYVGTLSVMVWDLLNNLKAEYLILTEHKIRLPTLIYCVSRLSTFAWLVIVVVFQTAPTGNCARIARVMSAMLAVAISSTSLLFFLRLRGVYKDNIYVVFFFFMLWLAVCCGSSTTAFTTIGTAIGPTKYCTLGNFTSIVSMSGLVVVVDDTLVFLAISWRVMKFSPSNVWTLQDAMARFFRGTDLPAFAKAFLQEGQAYYLSTIFFSFATTIITYNGSISLVYREMFGAPNLVVMNVMACRVFRHTMLGLYRDSTSTSTSNRSFPMAVTRPVSFNTQGGMSVFTSDTGSVSQMDRSGMV
ncbi:hypothetical protein GALMADRAFT_722528 [Galerina marginata CBS 339.88]|uniref:G-protein coupled receptors family 1 profile domain-containing protein n=1 Tax=Galerina marginata (strain CBS 339.88) TaxID=685588 RepID=A0A067T2A4_GALM3|nr:hypothetical protein GALMADRAFT_722528 [Galerina marginata CBS 339.88]